MESEIIETVLTEMLGELKKSNDVNKENSEIIIQNKSRLISIEQQLENTKNSKPLNDTESIEQIISTGINKINTIIEQRPEKVKREFRILLFPEHNTKEYYKIVFGRIIFWLVLLVIAKYMYLPGSKWISNEYENQKYKKAWENLYEHLEKPSQKMMKKILDNT
jgi:hypothetical protein